MTCTRWLVGLMLVLVVGLWVSASVVRAQEEVPDEPETEMTAPAADEPVAPPAVEPKKGQWRQGKGRLHGKGGKGRMHGKAKRRRHQFRMRFDANGDGKLDEKEKANLQAAHKALKEDPEMIRLREQVKQAQAKARELRQGRGRGKGRTKPTEEQKAAMKAARDAVKAAQEALKNKRESILAKFGAKPVK